MKEIPLSRGMVALVDDSDYERLSAYKWCVITPSPGTIYAYNGKIGYMHRFLTDAPKGMVVDHIDGNGLNNQQANMRVCEHRQNRCNHNHTYASNSSGYTGVYWNTPRQKWCSQVTIRGKTKTIGYFDDKHEAARARDKRARELHGEFAHLNFPD